MICRTDKTSTAYCTTATQFVSPGDTMLATLRWTKSSPGSRPTISLAGTRLSAQPIQRESGFWIAHRRSKKPGSRLRRSSDQARLFSRSFDSTSGLRGDDHPQDDVVLARGHGPAAGGVGLVRDDHVEFRNHGDVLSAYAPRSERAGEGVGRVGIAGGVPHPPQTAVSPAADRRRRILECLIHL